MMQADMLGRAILPMIIAAVSAAVLLVVRGALFGVLRRWAERSTSRSGEMISGSLRVPSVYWCIAIGLYLGIALSDLPEKYIYYISHCIHVIVIFSITIAVSNLAGNVFKGYVQHSNLPIPATGLAYGILKGTIVIVGLLVILAVLGISIAPLITALGVGGLAVALALQDTLSNLFAGIHILVEKSVRVGDFIRLESGQEGRVEDITWRTTRIRMRTNNIVVIPNNKLSQSVVTNYSLPEQRLGVQVQVSVTNAADPDRIQTILVEEAQWAARDLSFIVNDPLPSVVLAPGQVDGALAFSVNCQVEKYDDQMPAMHELRMRILRRLRREGVELPPPGLSPSRDGRDRTDT